MPADLTFLGHAACTIKAGDHTVAVDPFLTGNPQAEAAGITADSIECTHIALTHGHADHFGDTPAIAERTGATVIAAYEICEYLGEEHGIAQDKLEPGNPGGQIQTPFGSVGFTQAFHSSSYKGRYMGQPCGVVVNIGGVCVYHLGDTALFSDLRLIGELHRPNVALVPVGDRFTMGPSDASAAAEMIGPQIAVPVHYGTWPLLADDISAFDPAGVEVRPLKAGESLHII